MKGVLALSDGTILKGKGFGEEAEIIGEVVFTTSLVGYEESITDPSYKGQILTFTYPLIGNYGVRGSNFESDRAQVNGIAIHEYNDYYHHRNAVSSLDSYLKLNNIPSISGIDTRYLTKKLRAYGVMNGALITSNDEIHEEYSLKLAKRGPDYGSLDFLKIVSTPKPIFHNANGENTIALIDTGVKLSIIRNFIKRNINVWQMPYNTKAQEIFDLKPDGIFLTNGPGDPVQAVDAIELVQDLQAEFPITGICLGNQIIALALGGKTYKLKFGHRGINQPVKDLISKRVYITSQNHGYAVDKNSLDGTGLEVYMTNLNDGSVEGLCHKKLPIHTIQFHAEANPGPWDCNWIFDRFISELRR
ncbi:MAG: glutamine-hydrolyzing carbamoyl-phosphate synthase small subunit [Nanoarchaeota archaeon]